MALLPELNRQAGLTILYVLHDLTLDAPYCPRLVLFHRGREFASGSAGEVLTPAVVEEVYGCRVHVQSHPSRRLPQVMLDV